MAGMDAMRFLTSEDPVEVMVMAAIAKRWYDRREELDTQLAVTIVNTLGKGMKG